MAPPCKMVMYSTSKLWLAIGKYRSQVSPIRNWWLGWPLIFTCGVWVKVAVMVQVTAPQLSESSSSMQQGTWMILRLMSKDNGKKRPFIWAVSRVGSRFHVCNSRKDDSAGPGWDTVTTLAVISDHQLHKTPVYHSKRQLFRGGQTDRHTNRVNIKAGRINFPVDCVRSHLIWNESKGKDDERAGTLQMKAPVFLILSDRHLKKHSFASDARF